jgi:hypothetical protein
VETVTAGRAVERAGNAGGDCVTGGTSGSGTNCAWATAIESRTEDQDQCQLAEQPRHFTASLSRRRMQHKSFATPEFNRPSRPRRNLVGWQALRPYESTTVGSILAEKRVYFRRMMSRAISADKFAKRRRVLLTSYMANERMFGV